MPITQFTNLPDRGQDQTTFVERANDFLGRQLPRFVTEANATAAAVNADAAAADLSAQEANHSRIEAEQFLFQSQAIHEAVLGMVDFKGDWSALSGPLAPPASVRHRGRIWVLTATLPNVALAEPGVHLGAWEPIRRGRQVISANYSAQSGDDVFYSGASAVTVSLPAGPSSGDYVAVTRAGDGAVTVAHNGSTIINVTDNVTIDRIKARFVFVFAGGTWRIIKEGGVA